MIVETYFAPNKTSLELRELLDSHAVDPLRAFSDECRAELEPLKGFRDTRLRGQSSGKLHQGRPTFSRYMEKPFASSGAHPSRVVALAQGSSTGDSAPGVDQVELNQGAVRRTAKLAGST